MSRRARVGGGIARRELPGGAGRGGRCEPGGREDDAALWRGRARSRRRGWRAGRAWGCGWIATAGRSSRLEGRGDRGVLVAQAGRRCAARPDDRPLGAGARRLRRRRLRRGERARYSRRPSRATLPAAARRGPRAPITPGFGHAASPAVCLDGRSVPTSTPTSGPTGWRSSSEGGTLAAAGRQRQRLLHAASLAPEARCRLGAVGPPADAVGRHGTLYRHGAPRRARRLPTVTDIRVIAGDRRRRSSSRSSRRMGVPWPTSRTRPAGTTSTSTISPVRDSRALTEDPVEVGQPAWSQGMRAYSFAADGASLLFLRNEGGTRRLCRYDLATDGPEPLATSPTIAWIEQPAVAPGRARWRPWPRPRPPRPAS